MAKSIHNQKFCLTCQYALKYGWYGSEFSYQSHCKECGVSYTSTGSLGHATCCHRTFGSDIAFDKHRPNNVCTDPSSILRIDGLPWFELDPKRRCSEPVWRKRDTTGRASTPSTGNVSKPQGTANYS